MAHRNQFRGALAAENPGHLCHGQDIALFDGLLLDRVKDFRTDLDRPLGHRRTGGNTLPGDIHHPGISLCVKMSKLHRLLVLSTDLV